MDIEKKKHVHMHHRVTYVDIQAPRTDRCNPNQFKI